MDKDNIYHKLQMYTRHNSAVELDKIFMSLVSSEPDIDCFVEVGAFNGATSKSIESIRNESVDIYAFEASPFNFKEFADSFNESKIIYENLAVSNTTGKVAFYAVNNRNGNEVSLISEGNSLKKVDPQWEVSNWGLTKPTEYVSIEVDTVTLDNYLKETHYKNIVMWIDVEGVGYEVLQGAINTLKQTRFFKIEVEDRAKWIDEKMANTVDDFLIEHGFCKLIRDYEWHCQYNVIYVKETLFDTYKDKVKNILVGN